MILEWEEDNCKESNAYCFRFNQKCICQCSHGYFMVNGHCLEGKTSLKINFLCVLPSKIYFKCNYNFNFIVYSIIYFILDLVSLNNTHAFLIDNAHGMAIHMQSVPAGFVNANMDIYRKMKSAIQVIKEKNNKKVVIRLVLF